MTKNGPNEILKKLFEYTNYRAFLDDYFKEQKRLKSHFSHRFFAQKAGFRSPSFYSEIVKGKYSLSHRSMPMMVKGLGLNKPQAEYFETLVWLNQSTDPKEQSKYRRKLDCLRERTELYKLGGAEIHYLKEWYYQVIRELVCDTDWEGDYKKLGEMMIPPLPASKAREAVEILCKLDLVRKTPDGSYVQTSRGVSSEGIPASAMMRARRQTLEHSIESLEQTPSSERYMAYSTVAISKKSYEALKELMNETRGRMVDLVFSDEDPERIYEVVFQMFPATKPFSHKKVDE